MLAHLQSALECHCVVSCYLSAQGQTGGRILNVQSIWLPNIIERIVQHVCGNEVTCSLRLLDKATARLFAHQTLVRLSQPVPCDEFYSCWAKPHAMRTFSFHQRRKLLALTAATGCLRNLEVAVQHAGCNLASSPRLLDKSIIALDPLAAAAAAGHIHICEWLLQHGCLRDSRQLCAAARAGRQEACTWLLDHGWPCTADSVHAAAEGGHSV